MHSLGIRNSTRKHFPKFISKVFARSASWWKTFLSFGLQKGFGVASFLFSTGCPWLFDSRSSVGFFYLVPLVCRAFSLVFASLLWVNFIDRSIYCSVASMLFFICFWPIFILVGCLFFSFLFPPSWGSLAHFVCFHPSMKSFLFLKKIISNDDNGCICFLIIKFSFHEVN